MEICSNFSTLFRHRRTHETQQDGQNGNQPLSDDDLDSEEKEYGSLENDSPESDANQFVHPSVVSMPSAAHMPTPAAMTMHNSMPSMLAPHMIASQYLQQHI